jgi:hypothetical protein
VIVNLRTGGDSPFVSITGRVTRWSHLETRDSQAPRGDGSVIEIIILNRLGNHLLGDAAFSRQSVERRNHDGMTINLEKAPQ